MVLNLDPLPSVGKWIPDANPDPVPDTNANSNPNTYPNAVPDSDPWQTRFEFE